jgi:transcriptional regulator with XRE-family HTH domain
MTKEQLLKIRKDLNLTQTEFANKIGYSREHIGRVERGVKPVGVKLERDINNLIRG